MKCKGFFCKTADPGIIAKFADLGKNLHRPNLKPEQAQQKKNKGALGGFSPWAKPRSVERLRQAGGGVGPDLEATTRSTRALSSLADLGRGASRGLSRQSPVEENKSGFRERDRGDKT